MADRCARTHRLDSMFCADQQKMELSGNSKLTIKDFNMIQEGLQHQVENQCIESDIENYDNALKLNKRIISFLLDLKKQITSALQRCESKLTVVETSLRKNSIGDPKILTYNAGIPYFKDRDYFYAPNNEDEILKENQKELQLRNLPKVCPWLPKERDILLKAIHEEAREDMMFSESSELAEHNNVTSKLNVGRKGSTKQKYLSGDLKEALQRFQNREFNWFKISSTYFEDVHLPLDCRVMWNVFLHPDINKGCWTRSEDSKLKKIVKKYNFQNWDEIANELNTNRTAYQCFIRYNTTKTLLKPKNCVWKSREDKRLLKLVEIFRIGDFIPWGEVASWMKNRTKQQAYFRWTYRSSPNLIKGRFSKSEDSVLKDAVTKYGTNFCKISAALMPSRSTIQLHDRYQTLIINQTKNWNVWTLAEDSMLLELFECYGPNWSKIAESFSCKTRIQLRHRYAALQKHIKRGFSIFDLNKNHRQIRNRSEQEKQKEKEEFHQVTLDAVDNNTAADCCNDDVDKQLVEYFHMECIVEKSIHKRKPYTMEELKHRITNLYSILRLLNAKLCIPNNANVLKVSDENKQLLCSLREFLNAKNDKKKYQEIIDKYSSRMFGTNEAAEKDSHFVPPPPFDSQIKLKKSNETKCIDYKLSMQSTFLAEKPTNFNTPDYVISHIGGNEEELQFQKIGHLFEFNSSKDQRSYDAQDLCAFPIETFQSKSRNKNSDKPLEETRKYNTLFSTFENTQHFVPSVETISKEKDIPTIQATHATVLSFKNLIYLKQMNERHINLNQVLTKSKTFRESFNLLEIRLEQLLKYPIALSKTVLPEVYVMDTFSYDDIALSKETYKVSEILKKRKRKKSLT